MGSVCLAVAAPVGICPSVDERKARANRPRGTRPEHSEGAQARLRTSCGEHWTLLAPPIPCKCSGSLLAIGSSTRLSTEALPPSRMSKRQSGLLCLKFFNGRRTHLSCFFAPHTPARADTHIVALTRVQLCLSIIIVVFEYFFDIPEN